jgi:hypothetical protein
MISDKALAIAMLVVFIIVCFTTATVSTVRRNRRARSFSRDDPVNTWSPPGQHSHGHGWSGGGDSGGHHGGGWDGGSVGGHHR